eukprot:4086607-Amphidinium_carterae.2
MACQCFSGGAGKAAPVGAAQVGALVEASSSVVALRRQVKSVTECHHEKRPCGSKHWLSGQGVGE